MNDPQSLETILRNSRDMWVAIADRVPEFSKNGGDPSVLVYCPNLESDEDFPGHPYLVSNPEYVANGNASKYHGATHWMPILHPSTSVETSPSLAESLRREAAACKLGECMPAGRFPEGVARYNALMWAAELIEERERAAENGSETQEKP